MFSLSAVPDMVETSEKKSDAIKRKMIEAGYRAVLVDPQLVDPQHGISSDDGRVERIAATVLGAARRLGEIRRTENIVFACGFPPCTDVAVSGSRWFADKAAKDKHF